MTPDAINGAMALLLVMVLLLACAVLNSITGCRWLGAKLRARAFWLENSRADSKRWRAEADERCAAELAEYDIRPLGQVE